MPSHEHGGEGKPAGFNPTPEEIEKFYSESERVWSGNPNSTLVAVGSEMPAGRALDVGCGEGADMLWLLRQGWKVTGIDLSRTAAARTREVLTQAFPEHLDCFEVVHGNFLEFNAEPFDLVTVHYSQLPAQPATIQAMESLVAPGGTLLYVHHDFDSGEVASPRWVAENLVELALEKQYTSERNISVGAGAHHHLDVVTVAKRTG